MASPESRFGPTSRPDTRTFDRLIAQWREHEQQLADLARQADAILEEYEARARDEAEKILIDARLEAARIISNARAQVGELTEQIQNLTRTQREAASALEQTRRTLDSALGAFASRPLDPAPAPPSPPPSPPPPPPTSAPSTSTFSPGTPRPTLAPPPAPYPASAPAPSPPAPPAATTSAPTSTPPASSPPTPGTVSASFLSEARGQASRPLGLLSLDESARSTEEIPPAPAHTTRRRMPSKVAFAQYKRGAIVALVVIGSLGLAWVVATTWTGGTSDESAAVATVEPGAGEVGASRTAVLGGGLTLTIEARRPTWVRATIDGKGENGRLLEKGQKRTISANRDVVIRVGDAGALLVSVNGASATRLGRDGEVMTRRFGPDGSRDGAGRSGASMEADGEGASPPAESADAAVRTSGSAVQTASALPTQRQAVDGRASPAPAVSPQSAGRAQQPSGANVEQQILSADKQWFDSFYQKDRSTMSRLSAPGLEIVDTRPTDAKALPARPPERQLKDVRVDVHGDGAVMSGRMIEQVADGEKTRQRDAFISEVWVRRDGTWQLLGLRLAPADEVGGSSRSLR